MRLYLFALIVALLAVAPLRAEFDAADPQIPRIQASIAESRKAAQNRPPDVDVRADIEAALDRVATLKSMQNDPSIRYTLQARGSSRTGGGDDFLRMREPEEILASGLSSGCGDFAAGFYGLMRQKGYSLLYLDSAELTVSSLMSHFDGHTGVVVLNPSSKQWILVDPTSHKIIDENWDTKSKIYSGPAGRFWIGYLGRLEDYPVRSPDELKTFYDRTLRSVPSDVWDTEIVRLDFEAGDSMHTADGSWTNIHCPDFFQRYAKIYDDFGIHPRRRARITFSDSALNTSGKDCRRTGLESWECFVKPTAGMTGSWYSWIAHQVSRDLANN